MALALVVVWEAACRALNIPEVVLPTPTRVFQATLEFKELLLFS